MGVTVLGYLEPIYRNYFQRNMSGISFTFFMCQAYILQFEVLILLYLLFIFISLLKVLRDEKLASYIDYIREQQHKMSSKLGPYNYIQNRIYITSSSHDTPHATVNEL